MLEQFALADFIDEGHLERHIRRMRSLYGQRRQILVDSLECYFQDRARVLGSAAGMHAMVEFADPQIVRRATENKVQVPTADPCYLTRPPGRQLIFGFSAIGDRSIREGIRRLTL
jgi:GntR family transcriptional regulator/MocR family aminotransferase